MAGQKIELAEAYVSLIPSMRGAQGAVERELSGLDRVAAGTGRKMGKALEAEMTQGIAGVRKSAPNVLSGAGALMVKGMGLGQAMGREVKDITAQAKTLGGAFASGMKGAYSEARNMRGELNLVGKAAVGVGDMANGAWGKAQSGAQKARASAENFAGGVRNAWNELKNTEGSLNGFGRAVDRTGGAFSRMAGAAKTGIAGVGRGFSAVAGVAGRAGSSAVSAFSTPLASIRGKVSSALSGAFSPARARAQEAGRSAGAMFSESFKNVLKSGAMFAALGGGALGMKEIVQQAGDLEQSVGAVDEVFKGSAGQMHQWAQTAATSVGMSENEYNQFASVLGASLKNAGTPMDQLGGKTNNLIKLGADLSSMYGGSTSDAIDAVSAALRGEMDPIERYGISMNDAALTAKGLEMGIKKQGGAFTNQQKQLIVQKMLMEQSADAQGNFGRESDTLQHKQQVAAAQWKDLAAKIGTVFLPVLTGAMGWMSDHVVPIFEAGAKGLEAFAGAWQANDGVVTQSGFLGVMQWLGGTMHEVFTWLQQTSGIWGPFAVGIGIAAGAWLAYQGAAWLAAAATNAIIWPVTLTVAAIGLLIGGIILAYQHVGWFRDLVTTAWTWIQTVVSGFVSWWTGVAWPMIAAGLHWLGGVFVWLWQSVIVPAWNGISAAISWAWNFLILPIFNALSWFISSVIAPAFSWFWHSIVVPVWNGIGAAISWAWNVLIVPIFSALHWFIASVLAPALSWFWHSVVVPVWNGIGAAISWAWNVLVKPIFSAIHWFVASVLAPIFSWFWHNLIVPVWNGISWAINVAWIMIKNIFQIIHWFVQSFLAPVFSWFWHNIISPVWNGIVSVISWAWNNIIRPLFNALRSFVTGVLAPVFTWLWHSIIAPVWDGISSKITTVVNWIRDNVLAPLGNWVKTTFVGAWNSAKDMITKAWDKLGDAVKTPIKFVVDTVINKGFVNGFNKLNDWWGGDDIPQLNVGFATGGWTGPGGTYDPAGIVHADEFVINKRRRREFEAKYPGFLETINKTGDLPMTPQKTGEPTQSGGVYAGGTVPPHGPNGGIWSSVQAEASKVGHMNFADASIFGSSLRDAAKAWQGRSALDVRIGGSGPGVRHLVNGAQGGWGFYSGDTIQVNGAQVPRSRVKGVLIHEMGHALGLAHTAAYDKSSIMDHMMSGQDWPHAGDYEALVDVWGKPGKGVKTYDNPGGSSGGDSGSSWVVDKIRDWVKDKVDGLFGKAEDMFKTNKNIQLPISSAHKTVDGVIDKVASVFGGGSDDPSSDKEGSATKSASAWSGTIKDALKRVVLPTSDDYVQAWVRQVQTESAGNPNAKQGIHDVNSGGNEAAGLVQVTGSTFAAYRDKSLPNNRFDPLANLVAGMNYAKARYGSAGMLAAIGHGHGYAGGGLVKPSGSFAAAYSALGAPTLFDGGGWLEDVGHAQLVDHKRKDPDAVLTAQQWADMHRLAESVRDRADSGPTMAVSYTVQERPERTPEHMVQRMTQQLAHDARKAGII